MASRWALYGRRIAFLVQFGCFVHLFNEYVAEISACAGPSMLPTLNTFGDIIAIERISVHLLKAGYNNPNGYLPCISLGDLVVSVSPLNSRKHVCKRVLGLPGDNICVDPSRDPNHFITVPKGHVWLQGDNMDNSIDSRHYGPVPIALLRGRAFARVWPEPHWMDNAIREVGQAWSE